MPSVEPIPCHQCGPDVPDDVTVQVAYGPLQGPSHHVRGAARSGARVERGCVGVGFGDLDLSAVSVVIPARECAQTIGPIVDSISGAGQVLVLDAGSEDGTGETAAAAGAQVVQEAEQGDLLLQLSDLGPAG